MLSLLDVTTADERVLYGLLAKPKTKTDKILINIHGTASNFYVENFMSVISSQLTESGVATLATNNRGADALKGWEKGGATEEIFEDCLIDIDAWIDSALKQGYQTIYLSGHSLGTEKVVYYLSKGKHRDKIKAAILLAPADSYGTQMEFMKTVNSDLLEEARSLIVSGKGEQFLTSTWFSHAGVLPKSAESFLNFFSPDSELSKALSFHRNELVLYRSLKLPIFAVISDNEDDEYTVLPIVEALELMKKENPRTTTTQIPGADHVFSGEEQTLAEYVNDFIRRNP